MINEGLKKDTAAEEGAIYVKDHNTDVIKKIAASLQPQEWIGAIFTKASKPGRINDQLQVSIIM